MMGFVDHPQGTMHHILVNKPSGKLHDSKSKYRKSYCRYHYLKNYLEVILLQELISIMEFLNSKCKIQEREEDYPGNQKKYRYRIIFFEIGFSPDEMDQE